MSRAESSSVERRTPSLEPQGVHPQARANALRAATAVVGLPGITPADTQVRQSHLVPGERAELSSRDVSAPTCSMESAGVLHRGSKLRVGAPEDRLRGREAWRRSSRARTRVPGGARSRRARPRGSPPTRRRDPDRPGCRSRRRQRPPRRHRRRPPGSDVWPPRACAVSDGRRIPGRRRSRRSPRGANPA